jgi:amino acid transporter
MQLSILGVVDWRAARSSHFIVSTFVETIYGHTAATFITILILWIAFSSLFAALLGYSRIPYAAAIDGTFFRAFGKVHPQKHFPYVSLLSLGFTAFAFSLLFRLGEVISAIIAMRIIVQFVGQAAGIIYLRKRKPEFFPFKMWFYPLPALAAIVIWIALFFSTGFYFVIGGTGFILLGSIIFLIRANLIKEWPFNQ